MIKTLLQEVKVVQRANTIAESTPQQNRSYGDRLLPQISPEQRKESTNAVDHQPSTSSKLASSTVKSSTIDCPTTSSQRSLLKMQTINDQVHMYDEPRITYSNPPPQQRSQAQQQQQQIRFNQQFVCFLSFVFYLVAFIFVNFISYYLSYCNIMKKNNDSIVNQALGLSQNEFFG